MPGPPPDPRAIRRNKRPDKDIIKSDGALHGFALPRGFIQDKFGEEEEWHPATKMWWESWRKSPQAAQMLSEPDWFFLLDTALIHHNMWKNQKWEFANEVRMRVAKFGATPEDRNRLRMEIELPDVEPDAGSKRSKPNVTSIAERRKRLTG